MPFKNTIELINKYNLNRDCLFSEIDAEYCWKGVWTLQGDFGSVVYIELNTPADVYSTIKNEMIDRGVKLSLENVEALYKPIIETYMKKGKELESIRNS